MGFDYRRISLDRKTKRIETCYVIQTTCPERGFIFHGNKHRQTQRMNENLVTRRETICSPLFLFFPFFEKFNTLLRLHYSIRWLVVFRHDLSKMDFNRIKFREETNIFKSCVRIQPIFFPFFHLSSNVILLISRFNFYLFILPDNVSMTYREHDYRERSKNSKTLSLYNRITKWRFVAKKLNVAKIRTLVTLLSHVAKLAKWQVLAFVEGES